MLKFSLTLPIILSSLYISFSQAQSSLPACAQTCAQTAGSQAGCDITDPTCVCQNPTFLSAATSCVQQSCSASDAQAALAFWSALCSSSSSSASGTDTTATPSPSDSSSQSTTGSLPLVTTSIPITTSAPVTTSIPVTIVSGSSSNTTPSGSSGSGSSSSKTSGSSSSSSRSTSSSTSSSSTSNLAATMPTHAAALVAGGIGALVAVVV